MVKLLSYFLLALVPFFFNGSYNVIIEILNAIIRAIGPLAVRVVGMFPPNPCNSLVGMCSDAVTNLPAPDATLLAQCPGALAWLLPMHYLASLVGCLMLSVMIFFTMAPIGRWLKLIQ
jgi:hypothetical protein